jgi:hypothetical protein
MIHVSSFCLGLIAAIVIIVLVALVVIVLKQKKQALDAVNSISLLERQIEEIYREIEKNEDEINRNMCVLIEQKSSETESNAKKYTDSRFDRIIQNVVSETKSYIDSKFEKKLDK